MPSRKLSWKSKDGLAVGKGATIQEFIATAGDRCFEIDVSPWGEGRLKVNGSEIVRINDAKDRRQAFRNLAERAERFRQEPNPEGDRTALPSVKAKLLEGKRGSDRRHRQRPVDRLGLRQGVSGFRCRACGHLSQRQGEEIRRAAGSRARGVDPDAARRAARPGRWRRCSSGSTKEWGRARFRRALDRLLAQGGAAGPRRRRGARRLSYHHGCVVLDLHPHGAPGRAADARRAARCSP